MSRRRFLRSGLSIGAAGAGLALTASAGLVLGTTSPASAHSSQSGWRFCGKCYSLWYGGFSTWGRCTDGGSHTGAIHDGTSLDYVVPHSLGSGDSFEVYQTGWNHCPRCECLTWAEGNGWCPDGYRHILLGNSLTYAVWHDWIPSPFYQWQHDWAFCHRCRNIAYNGFASGPGWCPHGGRHDHSSTLGCAFMYG